MADGVTILDDRDRQRIAAAIREAESRTSGEIVCVLARSSDSYVLPALAALASAILLISLPVSLWLHMSWIAIPAWQFVIVQLAALAGSLAAIWLWPALRIQLVPRSIRYRRAHRNAVSQFLSRNIHVTEARTGVLIFLSLAERYAEIVADAGINRHVPQETWDGIVASLTREAAAGRVTEGFLLAISEAGALLARDFPPQPENRDELVDHLVEI